MTHVMFLAPDSDLVRWLQVPSAITAQFRSPSMQWGYMKRWQRVLGGVFVLAAFGAGVVWWKGPEWGLFKPKAFPVELPGGSQVNLMLLSPLDSGQSQVGDKVPCLVSEDVKSPSGYVVIKKGSGALVEVTRAREGSAMSMLANQPARLEIKFVSTLAVDGSQVLLASPAGTADFEITHELTERGSAVDVVKKLWEHSETQESLKSLNGVFSGGQWKAPDLKRALEDVTKRSNMPQTSEALKSDDAWNKLSETAGKVAQGDLTGLAGSDAVLALGALQEIGRVTGSVGDFLKGAIKGRNLTLPVGATLIAKTAKPQSITYTPEDIRPQPKK